MLKTSTIDSPAAPAPATTGNAPGNLLAADALERAGLQGWAAVGLLIAFLAVLYAHVAYKLVYDWYVFPDYSHGFLIPFFAAFLLWDERKRFLATPVTSNWAGIPIVAIGLFFLLVGVLGADLFFARTSFVILAAGLILSLLGRRMLVRSRFLLFVLLLAIPFPTLIFNHITFPLQLLASRLASALLPLAGVPVLREGNVISLPSMQLEVAEACSGIRSLMSLFTVAVIFGYFVEKGTLRRSILAISAIPIAVAANAMRIFGTGLCVQYWDPEKALGFFHEFSGWLIFIVSLICLYIVQSIMNRFPRRGSAQA